MFALHPQLTKDTHTLGYFTLCRLLISRDANYPWFIMVPQRADVRELHHLAETDRQQVLRESCALSNALERVFSPDKLNVAALGNQVPQLHIHHIVRFENDPAWPGPVWGAVPPVEYKETELQQRISAMIASLQGESGFTAA